MEFPLALQPECTSRVGYLVHQFANLPLLDNGRKGRSLTERVTAYAFRFFILLPTITLCSLGEVLENFIKLIPFLIFAEAPHCKSCIHTLAIQLLFPLITLGYTLKGDLPPANRTSYLSDCWYSKNYDLGQAIREGNIHLAKYLFDRIHFYYILDIGYYALDLCHNLEYDERCNTLMACLEPLDSKKKTVLLSHSLYDNKSSYILSRLIWDCVNEETKDPWRSAYQLCDSILKKQNPKIDLYIDVQEAVEILSHSLERLRKDPICAPFTQVTPATNLSREISVSDNLKKLVDILHKIHNIKQHVANRTGSLETTIQASIPIPKVIAHLVAQYLEPTFQIEPIPSPARYYRDPFGESLEGIEAEHIVSGVRSAYRYHTLTNKMLCNISHALEKKLFSPWFRRYTSVKFLGTLAFGTYLTLEVWVFRPLLCCLVFVAVAAEKIYQLFSCLIKAAVSSQNRRNNLKCCAVALPLLITNILYIFLATLTGLFQLISGGLTTQPIMRSIKLYTRSIE